MSELEIIIEVDEQDRPIGNRPRSEFAGAAHIHRTSHLLLLNPEGQLLLPKRPSIGKLYSGRSSFSAAGWVREGETYEQTLERQAQKELGIQLESHECLFTFRFTDEREDAFKTVYRSVHEGPFQFNPEDSESQQWVELGVLRSDLSRSPKQYSPPFVVAMKQYFDQNA
ncbi:MAG: NUDIX domain-containing protein [Nanoarchaeota archaeon]